MAGGTGHPGLWLLIGFMASINLSPTDVVQHCRPLGGSSILLMATMWLMELWTASFEAMGL
jgi:hypothetical protein